MYSAQPSHMGYVYFNTGRGCLPPVHSIPMQVHQPHVQAQPQAFGTTGPFQPAQLRSSIPAQQGPPGSTPYTAAPQFQQIGSMMFPNYAMPSSYLPHTTMLPHVFQTMTLQQPNWNMDTWASSHLAENTSLNMAVYLLNILPSTAINNEIPFTKLYKKPPTYDHLLVFGCLCYPHIFFDHKLQSRSTACVFLGYPALHRGYRCLDLSTNKIIISRHVIFDEDQFPSGSMTPDAPPSYDFLLPSQNTLASQTTHTIDTLILDMPTGPPPANHPYPNQTHPINHPETTTPGSTPTPEPTVSGPHTTPTPPSPPSNTQLTPPAAAFLDNAPPTNTHHMVTRAKASISKPLARMNCHVTTTSPIPLSHLHALCDPHWHKAMLSETVYMHQPPGFVDSSHPDYVCHLQRSLYGLKQAPRAWFQRVRILLIFSYVDDIVLTASSTALLQRIIRVLHGEFAMTELGSLNYFLGISAQRTKSGLFLSQSKFAEEILEWAQMQHCALQYLTFTRPDISYAVQQICLYMHDPRYLHFHALKRILRYVQETIDHGLQLYVSSTSQLTTFTDVDWVTLSRSSAEAEYRGVANVVAKAAWIRNLLLELHAPVTTATLVYCDNVSLVLIMLGTNKLVYKLFLNELQHPAPKMLVLAMKEQLKKFGDGANLVVSISGQHLEDAKQLITMGLNPRMDLFVKYAGQVPPDDEIITSLALWPHPWEKVAKQRVTQSFSPETIISFSSLGEEDGTEGPMIIEAEIGGHLVHRIYMDGGACSEVLYEHCFIRLRPEIRSEMIPATTSLIGFNGETIWPIGQISLLVRIGDEEHSTSAWMNFMVIRSPSQHNGIIGRTGIRKIRVVPSTTHGMLKFSVKGGTITIQSSRVIPMECAMLSGLAYNTPPADMTGVPRHMAEHRLNFREGCPPIRQKKKGQAPERNKAIQEEVEKLEGMFLGYKVNAEGLKVCPDKADAVLSLPSPGCLKDVQKLNGKLASLNRFLSKLAEKSLPFFKTLKKCTKKGDFQWTQEAKIAFKQMRNLIVELPMLTALKEKEELIMYLAAMKEAINAVLMTERGGKQLPVYFVSRALRGPEINYTPMEKLVLALLSASRRLKRYFQAHTIVVITDQPKKQLLSKSEISGRMLKWKFELEGYDIQYRPRTSIKGQILADFIVERPDEESPDELMAEPKELPEPWTLFTDGSSCIDGFGAGLILTNPDGVEFTYAMRFRFEATNNEAEYEALIAGLWIAEQMGVKNLQANVDSRLVANQVNGSYVAKESGMVQYLEKVKTLASNFKEFSIKQVPRSENKKADALSKIASTSFAHLSKQVLVEELKEKSIHEKEVLAIVEEEGKTWMTPICEYLTKEILPEDKKKATVVRRKASRYTMINGTLYKKSFLGPWLRCVGPLQANYVLREIHEGSCSMHSGPRSVVAKAIRTGYYWPTMHTDARKLIRECNDCQGPGKVKFLIVAIDYFTKWIEAKPVATITGNQVKKFVWDNIVCRFGLPGEIVSDNEKQFRDNPFKDCKQESGRRNQSSIGRKKQGLNKRTLTRPVGTSHHDKIKQWGDTVFTNIRLEAVIPAEIGMPTLRTAEIDLTKNDEALKINLDLIEEKREQAAIQEAKSKAKMGKYYNFKVRSTSFRPRDMVYRSNDASHAKDGRKLGPKWEGPYKVGESLGNGAYKLKDHKGNELP
ncbi:reverse transcriptase domain-containing protein [Tanacetum coccineum]